MSSLISVSALPIASFGYLPEASLDVREQIGATARPITMPAAEPVNVPAFMYVVSPAILAAGMPACLICRHAVRGPRLFELRQIWPPARDVPSPRARGVRDRVAWPAFLGEAVRAGKVPQRPSSTFVAQEPDFPTAGDDVTDSLPSYLTLDGLIFTFVWLVVALYFAAEGLRPGDPAEPRAAIIQFLDALSFEALTSVSAPISARMVTLATQHAASRAAAGHQRTRQEMEIYLVGWREKLGRSSAERGLLAPADLPGRFDALLAGIQAPSADPKRLVAHAGAWDRDVAV